MFAEQKNQSPNSQLDDDLIFEKVLFSEDLAQESLPEGSTSSEASEEAHFGFEGNKSEVNRDNKLKSATIPIEIVSKSQKKNSQNKKPIVLPEVKNKKPENIIFQIKSTETVANEPANRLRSYTDKKEEWSFDDLFSTSPSSRPEFFTGNIDSTPAKSTSTSINIPKHGNKYNKSSSSVEGDIYRDSSSSYEININQMINAIKRYIKNRTVKPEKQVVKHLKSFFGAPTQSEKLDAANALIGYLNKEISYDQLRAYEKDFQPSTELGKIYISCMSKHLIISPSNSLTP